MEGVLCSMRVQASAALVLGVATNHSWLIAGSHCVLPT
jgi:hypothetical protein